VTRGLQYSSKRVNDCLDSITTQQVYEQGITKLGMQMIFYDDSKGGDTAIHALCRHNVTKNSQLTIIIIKQP